MIEAGLFDLDLTLINLEGRLYPGLDSIVEPNNHGFAMTVLTGRGYPRYREALEKNPELILPASMPVALEHGARIVDGKGENLHYVGLSERAVEEVCDYIDRSPVHSVSFYPRDTQAPTVTWSPYPQETLNLGKGYLVNATLLADKGQLFEALQEQEPCTVTYRSFPGTKPVLPTGLDDVKFYTRGRNINFLSKYADKGKAGLFIAERKGFDLSKTLAAGNDRNDLPLLQMEGLGVPIFVGTDIGPQERRLLPNGTIFVPDQRQLGGLVASMTIERRRK